MVMMYPGWSSCSLTMAYLFGAALTLWFSLVRGQSGEVDADAPCIAQHTSIWGDHMATLKIQVSQCSKGYIEWKFPKGYLKVIFEDSWNNEFGVCLEQMDLSPWTAVRNMTYEIDNRIKSLRLPVGRPTCAQSQGGFLKICLQNPQLRVYRTSLYFYISRAGELAANTHKVLQPLGASNRTSHKEKPNDFPFNGKKA